jgi:hypothetical protein
MANADLVAELQRSLERRGKPVPAVPYVYAPPEWKQVVALRPDNPSSTVRSKVRVAHCRVCLKKMQTRRLAHSTLPICKQCQLERADLRKVRFDGE